MVYSGQRNKGSLPGVGYKIFASAFINSFVDSLVRHTEIVPSSATSSTFTFSISKISSLICAVYNDMPAFRIKVNGWLHAGYVTVALNGSDYYEVYLLKEDDSNAKCVNEEVCFDELGDVIDRAIESGTDKEEYDKFCDRQLAELLSGTRA